MTKDISENNAPHPVQSWENRQVKGEALSSKCVHEQHVAKVAELRSRQEAYEASLPKEPGEALSEISRVLTGLDDSSEPQYAARAALEIIHQLTSFNALDDSEEMNDAIRWLSIQGLDGLKAIETASKRASDIAHQFHPRRTAFQA